MRAPGRDREVPGEGGLPGAARQVRENPTGVLVTAGPVLAAGIIGAGRIGRRHATTLARRDDLAVRAACDPALGRAQSVAADRAPDGFSPCTARPVKVLRAAPWVRAAPP